MATIEQRLQAVEQAVENSKITPQLPQLLSIEGNEQINIWSPELGRLCKYSYADVLASGSVDPTNDVIPVFRQVPNIDFNIDVATQIASYINSSASFDKGASEIIWYYVTKKISDTTEDTGFSFHRDFYLFAKPKGNYGSGSGVTIQPQELLYQTSDISNTGNIQTETYNASLGYDINTVINSATAFTPISTANIVIEVIVNGNSEYWLYQGKTTEDIGTGEYQTVISDLINLQTVQPDPNGVLNSGVTGWANYEDTNYTVGSPFSVSASSKTVIPNNKGVIIESQLPDGVASFYNSELPSLNYDAETGAFTVDDTLTGATSGATATIRSITDNGTTGTLFLNEIQGEFEDNELITDDSTGSATVDGTINAGKILGLNGDSYVLTLEMKAKPTTSQDTTITVFFEIGLPSNKELYKREQKLGKGQNVEHYITLTTSYYTLDTWQRNGGILYISSNRNVDLYDIRFVISRIHKAK